MKAKLLQYAALLATASLIAVSQASAVPELMSYQGRVTDASGTLIGDTAPVNRAVIFRLYTEATGGTVLYAETQSVTISGGEFSVLIGNGTGISGAPGPSAPASPFTSINEVINTSGDSPLYLGITVDDGNSGTASAEIAPRQQLVSGAFAVRAGMAETVASGAVTSNMLGTSSVATGNIQTKAINSSKVADGGISTLNIANSAITIDKLNTDQIGVWTPSGNNVWRNGNVGIGQSNPGFPLNFSNNLGNKIALWGNSGNHYGLGIQSSLLQIYSGGSGSDVAFGHGHSGDFTENMRVRGNGNVGIGTKAPTQKLHVFGGNATIENNGSPSLTLARGSSSANLGLAGASGQLSGSAATNDAVLQAATGKLHLQTGTGSAAVSIDSANRVGVGNASPNANLTVGNNLGGSAHSSTLTTNSGSLGTSAGSELLLASFGAHTGDSSSFGISAYRKQAGSDWHTASMLLEMNVDNSKRVGGYLAFGANGIGIGTTQPSYPLDVQGRKTAPGIEYGYLNASGNTGKGTGPSSASYSIRAAGRVLAWEFNAVSDARLKTNIQPLTTDEAFRFVAMVDAVQYNWVDDEDSGKKFGFLAQDVVKAGFADLVGHTTDPEMQEVTDESGFTSPAGARLALNYEQITPLLVVAIKQLKSEMDEKDARMAEKDIRITDLETRLATLEELILSSR